MNHVVPTLGFVFEDRDSAVAIASDTAPTDEFWKRIRNIPNLRAVVLEASFPDEMSELAGISMHLTPRLFAAELAKLQRPDIPVIAVHIKPKFYDTVVAQVAALRLPQVQIVKPGQSYTF